MLAAVLLAVRNGEEFIRGKLECLLGLDSPAHVMEILVASDGSTDATEPIAESFAGRGVRLIRASRAGKAAAVKLAIAVFVVPPGTLGRPRRVKVRRR